LRFLSLLSLMICSNLPEAIIFPYTTLFRSNAVINPSTVKASLPISLFKKKVKLNLKPKNEKNNKVYSVTAKNDEVTLYGQKETLAKIKQLDVDVDLKGISYSTVKNYPLVLPKVVARVDSENIKISIKVKNANN